MIKNIYIQKPNSSIYNLPYLEFTGIIKQYNPRTLTYDFAVYKKGKLHCSNGPAVKTADCEKFYKDGLLHKLNGPAIKTRNSYAYYKNGVEHRENGPAYSNNQGDKRWLYNGKEYGRDNEFNVKTWKEKVEQLKLEIFK